MNLTVLIIAAVGVILAIGSAIFLFVSDFGCIQGNVGPAGLTGPQGIVGEKGHGGQVVFAIDPDLVELDITVGNGHTQPSFSGTLLKETGYAVSWWDMSLLSAGTAITLDFQVLNNDIVVPLTPISPTNIISIPVTVVANVRQEFGTELHILRTGTKFTILCEQQASVFTFTIIDVDSANIAVRVKGGGGTVYNRANDVHVYEDTAITDTWCGA